MNVHQILLQEIIGALRVREEMAVWILNLQQEEVVLSGVGQRAQNVQEDLVLEQADAVLKKDQGDAKIRDHAQDSLALDSRK